MGPDVEAGAKAVYDTKATTPAVNLEVGVKTYVTASYPQNTELRRLRVDHSYLDEAAFVKAKINNAGILALGE